MNTNDEFSVSEGKPGRKVASDDLGNGFNAIVLVGVIPREKVSEFSVVVYGQHNHTCPYV